MLDDSKKRAIVFYHQKGQEARATAWQPRQPAPHGLVHPSLSSKGTTDMTIEGHCPNQSLLDRTQFPGLSCDTGFVFKYLRFPMAFCQMGPVPLLAFRGSLSKWHQSSPCPPPLPSSPPLPSPTLPSFSLTSPCLTELSGTYLLWLWDTLAGPWACPCPAHHAQVQGLRQVCRERSWDTRRHS